MNARIVEQTPTAEQVEALQAFADAHGRRWREELIQVYWYNARLWLGPGHSAYMGSTLHGIRNQFGPAWLYDVCKIKPARKGV